MAPRARIFTVVLTKGRKKTAFLDLLISNPATTPADVQKMLRPFLGFGVYVGAENDSEAACRSAARRLEPNFDTPATRALSTLRADDVQRIIEKLTAPETA